MTRVRSAFTLIELLVVIAIIAILAAILFPVFAQARESARQTSCLSNTKQLNLGILQYVQDYDEKFPIWCFGVNNDPNQWAPLFGPGTPDKPWGVWKNRHFGWDKAVQPYVKNVQIFRCPSTGDGPAQENAGTDDSDVTGAVAYGLNAHLSGRDPGDPLLSRNLAGVRFPATCIMLAEVSRANSTGETTCEVNWLEWGYNGGHDRQLNGDNNAGNAGWDGNDGGGYKTNYNALCHQGTGTYWGNTAALRHHKGGANYAFVDGHSKWYTGDASCVVWDTQLVGGVQGNQTGRSMSYIP